MQHDHIADECPFEFMLATLAQPIDRPRDGERMTLWQRVREIDRAYQARKLYRDACAARRIGKGIRRVA